MKKKIAFVFAIFFTLFEILYIPFYVIGWVLRIVARFLLSISYFLMLQFIEGKNVFKSIFKLI